MFVFTDSLSDKIGYFKAFGLQELDGHLIMFDSLSAKWLIKSQLKIE